MSAAETERNSGEEHFLYFDTWSPLIELARMRIEIISTKVTTTIEPYTQLPRDRIELHEHAAMIFFPPKAQLQRWHPGFCERLERNGIQLRADPAQLDAPLLRGLRSKVGIRIGTDDVAQVAALLDLDEEDHIFDDENSQTGR